MSRIKTNTKTRAKMAEPKMAPKPQLPATYNPQQQQQAVSRPDSLLGAIMAASTNPKVKPEKLRELLDIKRGIDRDHWIAEFNTDFLEARNMMPPIVRDAQGDKGKYPSLENVSTQIDGIARRCGFTHSWGHTTSPLPNHYRITCILRHRAGHHSEYFGDYPADLAGPKGNRNKSDVQAVGSTNSYARRVMKIMIWDLVIAGSDRDGTHIPMSQDATESISAEQNEKLMHKIAQCGVPIAKVLDKYKIKKLTDLPEAAFNDVIAACDKYASEAEQRQRQQ